MNEAQTKKIKSRVNRISGQVNGIGKMIEEDRYCLEILDQIAAVRSALDSLGVELLSNHLENCVIGHGTCTEHPKAAEQQPKELVAELRDSLQRFLR